jgi:hypothetical protein
VCASIKSQNLNKSNEKEEDNRLSVFVYICSLFLRFGAAENALSGELHTLPRHKELITSRLFTSSELITIIVINMLQVCFDDNERGDDKS